MQTMAYLVKADSLSYTRFCVWFLRFVKGENGNKPRKTCGSRPILLMQYMIAWARYVFVQFRWYQLWKVVLCFVLRLGRIDWNKKIRFHVRCSPFPLPLQPAASNRIALRVLTPIRYASIPKRELVWPVAFDQASVRRNCEILSSFFLVALTSRMPSCSVVNNAGAHCSSTMWRARKIMANLFKTFRLDARCVLNCEYSLS